MGRVDKYIEGRRQKRRPYLGMSDIGDPCSRRLWLKLHGKFHEKHSARVLRMFHTGTLIEKRIIRDLKAAKFKVYGTQREYSDFDGMLKGHCDGIIEGLPESSKPHLLEIKSASDKSFKEFQKNGVEKHSLGPKYWGQINLYMGYEGLERGLFLIENKDTGERYQERVHFDRGLFSTLVDKAGRIITAPAPPRGISERPDWWACKFCFLNHDGACRKVWQGEVGW